MSGPVRIVRKVGHDGYDPQATCGVWLRDGEPFGWWEQTGDLTPAEAAAAGEGWAINEAMARNLGTTLSALHQELTEGGEGANDSQV